MVNGFLMNGVPHWESFFYPHHFEYTALLLSSMFLLESIVPFSSLILDMKPVFFLSGKL